MAKNGLALETELRLGLPGGGGGEKKRVFSDMIFGGEEEKAAVAVVGWPPVRAYRRKIGGGGVGKMYVKVSMDGAPFLRKIDLTNHKCYSDLFVSIEQLFGCFGIEEALKDSENSEYSPIYEDKDGDWMLLGDVPWEMFVDSCKRMRIMKRSDANGLQAIDLLKELGKKDDRSEN
ncbi:hypothetical protein ABFX02_09G096900 [Erythranthe guttata]